MLLSRTTQAPWVRAAAAVFVGGALALSGGGVAAADATTITGKQLYLDSPADSAKVINSKDPARPAGSQVNAARLGLKVGTADPVLAYCIDFTHDIEARDNTYQESTWAPGKNGSPTKDELSQVQWILTHSYPNATVDAVITAAHGVKPANTSADLLTRLVYAGTQTAIWSITDSGSFGLKESNDGFNTTPNAAADQYALIVAIKSYLFNAAKNPVEEPQPKLVITPATLSGLTGKKIGPFTVESGGGLATLTAVGGKLVDADGKPVTTLPNGGKFYVLADVTGTVTINAKGSGSVPIGRVFKATLGPDARQKLILAGVAGTELEASATATVTVPPATPPATPSLPVTGVQLTGAITAGVLLIAGGALLLVIVRRRRSVKFTA